MATTFDRDDLQELTALAKGGFGQVYRVERHSLPAGLPSLAFKEFTSNEDVQAAAARRVVEFRDGLSAEDRDELDEYTVWPLALVAKAGKVCGVLMPLIPTDFSLKVQGKNQAQDLQWLITTQAYRDVADAKLGEVDRAERLSVLAQLVYVIARLHSHGWVFGDISFKNAVFAVNPPRLKLIDCDGAAPLSDKKRELFSTPFWDPPECPPELQDKRSDTYKLALAVLRCLTPGTGAATSRSPARVATALNPVGVTLIGEALSPDPVLRPTAKDLYFYLRDTVTPLIKAPVIQKAELASNAILRGTDARINWTIEGGTEVTIVHGNNTRIERIKLVDQPDGYGFTPDMSGAVMIVLHSRYGDLKYRLGDLVLYKMPDITVDFNSLPRPTIPAIGAFSLDSMTATLAGRPSAGDRCDQVARNSIGSHVRSREQTLARSAVESGPAADRYSGR